MKLLVFSDSHGRSDLMQRAIEREQAQGASLEGLLFAGDGFTDALLYKDMFPVFYAVGGNCDSSRSEVPREQTFTLRGITVYLCHGHKWHVKLGTQRLTYRAQEVEAKIAIYGHTHRQKAAWQNGVLLLNPGAIAAGQYAVLTLPHEGLPEAELKEL